LAVIYRLPTAELAPETKNQFADHIDLRTVSKPEPLTPKIEVASSSGPTGSYGLLLRPELHIGCWQTAREHKMGVSGRSAGWLLRLGVLWAHAAHGSGRNGHRDLSSTQSKNIT